MKGICRATLTIAPPRLPVNRHSAGRGARPVAGPADAIERS